MIEIWKDIPEYNTYQVSSFGRMRRKGREKLLALYTDSRGYISASVHKKGIKKRSGMHRWVALAFLENPENKPVVNHLDGNPSNNKLDNLEWATYSRNTKHAYEIGLITPIYKANFYAFNFHNGRFMGEFTHENEAAIYLNIKSRRNVNSCLRKTRAFTSDFIFIYKSDYTIDILNQSIYNARNNPGVNFNKSIAVFWIGELVGLYDYIKDCAIDWDISPYHLNKILNKKRKNTYSQDFVWVDNDEIDFLLST